MDHDGEVALTTSLLGRNIFYMILVAALWGCTNPFLAKGVTGHSNETIMNQNKTRTFVVLRQWIPQCMHSLLNFGNLSVLIPYATNQCGSILYYYTLASCNLSLVVPCCNALSLAFALGTSYLLGEKVNSPLRAVLGSVLVTLGVAICMLDSSSNSSELATEKISFISERAEL